MANAIAPPAALSGQTLAQWRERMGYSKREAAEVIGCSRASWSAWESGSQPTIPRYIGLAMAALALGMTAYGDIRQNDKVES